MRRSLSIVGVCFAVLVGVPTAGSAPGMFVGISDDGLKWNTGTTVAVARDLGVRAFRITLRWDSNQTELFPRDAAGLASAVAGASGMRIVLAVYNQGSPPLDDQSRDRYCTYVGNVITRFPQINDVIIWDEPNLSAFWQPQYSGTGVSEAPARYEQLLARCYDVLHGLRPGVNVIAPATSLWGNDNPNAFSNIGHSPATFIREMGDAYRASGRTAPLFDTVGHHPYPATSNERPWKVHADPTIISLGDIDRLLGVLHDAFAGTGQPLPENGVPIWYLETGYQTLVPPAKAGLYTDVENWPGAVPDVAAQPGPPASPPDDTPAPDQATELVDSIRMTYCQTYIGAIFNFLLRDETSLAGWQSGLLWADGSPKGSYGAFRSVVGEVNAGTVDCSLVAGAPGVTASAKPASTQAAPPTQTRSITKVTYKGGKRVPYGFLRPRAQLTRGVTYSNQGLSSRQMLFLVGSDSYLTTTDASGTAAVMPMPPVRPGKHRIKIRFDGDQLDLGSGLRVDVSVVNSRARVRMQRMLRLAKTLRVKLSARSNGRSVSGTLVLRDRGVPRTVRLTAFGLRADSRAAWLGGTDRSGSRYVIHIERLPKTSLTRVRIWRNNAALNAGATVPAAELRLTRR